MLSCHTRGFCPSCHAKRLEEWGEWLREELLLDVPHRQVVFVIPKMLRIFFKYKRRLLGDLCQAAVQALLKYFQATTGTELLPGVVTCIQTFGDRINLHPHVHCLVREGGEDEQGRFHHVQSFDDHLIAEFFSREVFALLLGEELISEQMVEKIAGWRHSGFNVHSRVRAEMIRKVYEVDPLVCPQCGGQMKVISFITEYAVVDRIIHHLKLTFVADKPPPPHLVYQELLMDSETGAEYFS